MVIYDLDEIINKLVENKVEANGKIIYPGIKSIFDSAKHLGLFIGVGNNGKELIATICDPKDDYIQKILKDADAKPEHQYFD